MIRSGHHTSTSQFDGQESRRQFHPNCDAQGERQAGGHCDGRQEAGCVREASCRSDAPEDVGGVCQAGCGQAVRTDAGRLSEDT